MLITVAAHKGGVAKSTTSVHLASFLQARGSTLLIDEEGGGATDWAQPGLLPFRTVLESEAAEAYDQYQHHVIDTGARADAQMLVRLAEASDFLVIPTTPDALALSALLKTIDALRSLAANKYAVLLTMTPPWPSKDSDEARNVLKDELGLNIFDASIPRAVAFQKAALSGVLVGSVRDPRAHACAAAYEAVGMEVLKRVRE